MVEMTIFVLSKGDIYPNSIKHWATVSLYSMKNEIFHKSLLHMHKRNVQFHNNWELLCWLIFYSKFNFPKRTEAYPYAHDLHGILGGSNVSKGLSELQNKKFVFHNLCE